MVTVKWLLLLLHILNAQAFFPPFSTKASCPNFAQSKAPALCKVQRENPVIVLQLNGSMFEMGKAYGGALSFELQQSLDILTKFYQSQTSTYEKMLESANQFQERYTREWDLFLQGMAVGSGLKYDDCKILNAMETLQLPTASDVALPAPLTSGCTFAYISGKSTLSGSPLIARNYDYPPPFDQIARNLILTIFYQQGKVPTAIVGMPGQIYCPTCINANGYYLELNNGAPSGGSDLDQTAKPSMLINMLDVLREDISFEKMTDKLQKSKSDYSLIINAVSPKDGRSLEYSTRNSSCLDIAFKQDHTFVSTNFFLNPLWGLDPPTDENAFIGVTRRNNLLELLNQYRDLTLDQLKNIMDIDLENGGAKWKLTIYQVIFDYKRKVVSLKVPSVSEKWIDVDLTDKLFD